MLTTASYLIHPPAVIKWPVSTIGLGGGYGCWDSIAGHYLIHVANSNSFPGALAVTELS